jgi:hypothetical protein
MTLQTIFIAILTLIFPVSGVVKATEAIFQHTITCDSPLEAAKRQERFAWSCGLVIGGPGKKIM